MSIDTELARFDHEVGSLEGALDMAIKLASRALDALRNEEAAAVAGAGITRRRVDLDFTRRVREVTSALEAATRCQVSLDKTATLRAKQMSPEERLVAFEKAVEGMPYKTRRKFIVSIVKAHNDKQNNAVAQGVTEASPDKWFIDVA
jgi:hypothetical protein